MTDFPQKNLSFSLARVERGVLLHAKDEATGATVVLTMSCAGTHALVAILEHCADSEPDKERDYDTTICGRLKKVATPDASPVISPP